MESFNIVPFKDTNDVEKEGADEFGKLLAKLSKKVYELESGEAKARIVESLELLEKVNNKELKNNSSAIAVMIIDNIENLIKEYKASDLDKEIKKAILIRIKNIKDHCEEYFS